MDLFDRHLYEKGGITLNMLRVHLGEELFWKAIRRYAISRRSSNVVTPDLQRAIEEATGRNLDWFFDQWVYGAGHPEMKGDFAWDEATKTGEAHPQAVADRREGGRGLPPAAAHRLQARGRLLGLDSRSR